MRSRGPTTATCRRWSCSAASAASSAEALLIVNCVLPPDATSEQVAAAKAGSDAALAFTSGTYGNFSMDRGEEVIASMYPPATLERLRRIKAELDPGNVFRQNHNITPAG